MSTPEDFQGRRHPYGSQFFVGPNERSTAQTVGPAASRSADTAIHGNDGVTENASLRTRLLHGVKYFMPDAVFLFFSHRRRVGRFPNLIRRKTFNEFVLHRCLHPDPIWSTLADKLAVREYVKDRIGEQYLVPLIAAPDLFTRDVFDALPASFVMKANHGCAFVKVVRDKSQVSFEELKRLADQWLAVNFYRNSRERHYRSIKPRLYFEKLLLDSTGTVPPDYKINIFPNAHGDPVVVTGVVTDRFGSARHDFYDTHWNRMDIVVGDYPLSEAPAPRLPNWDEVMRVATRLVEGLGYARVDLYVFENKIFFGELTFTPGAGVSPLNPERYDREWGKLLNGVPSSR
jgi:hypothetical protein